MEAIILVLAVLIGISLMILWTILPVIIFRMSQKMDRLERVLDHIEWNTRNEA